MILCSSYSARSEAVMFHNAVVVDSWSRWADILKHGHFKHKLEVNDIRTIARAMVSYCCKTMTVCWCYLAFVQLVESQCDCDFEYFDSDVCLPVDVVLLMVLPVAAAVQSASLRW